MYGVSKNKPINCIRKGYLCYKTILCYKVALDVFFYLNKKIMFYSQDIEIFVFL